jgi:hypothetical protein
MKVGQWRGWGLIRKGWAGSAIHKPWSQAEPSQIGKLLAAQCPREFLLATNWLGLFIRLFTGQRQQMSNEVDGQSTWPQPRDGDVGSDPIITVNDTVGQVEGSDTATKSANQCGTCTLCCKLVHVDEINKPVGKWCDHCALGKGCKIYDTRPTECRTWNCLWLQGAFGSHPDLRPDKCKVVVGYQAGFLMVVEDASPPKSGLRFVEELKTMGKPMVIKRYGQPGIKLVNATSKEALAAGVIH